MLLFFNSIAFSQSFWTKINSPVNVNLRNCVFTDSLNGWASGDDGVIIHTSDGGNTFVIQNSTIPFYINDIFFLNSRLGWVVANEFVFSGTTILTTTNGGLLWTSELFSDTTLFFKTIYFRDSLNGYMAGISGSFYKTSDAGNSWIASIVDSSEFSTFPVNKIIFTSEMNGFACGGYIDVAGIIWRTIDGGINWTAGAYSPEPFYDLYVKDINNIFSVGGDFEYGVQISRTSNSGNNWIYESLKMFGQAESIDFRTPGEAWMALGFASSWAVSQDSGNTWKSIPVVDGLVIHSVAFADSLHGLAVGNDGAILKYNPEKVSINQNQGSTSPGHFKLEQNYPNPFNPVTDINYVIPSNVKDQKSNVKLTIYNSLGIEINKLVNEYQNPGSYKVKFDAGDLPSGVYFYELKILSGRNGEKLFSETKKMLLVK
ncbi:MAG: T9SS type A sorting domain-containing protein [Ignavibacteria bacterium]|nr:T9SS type A sorting domain-containing protein [Ignavibacteria bacterium]